MSLELASWTVQLGARVEIVIVEIVESRSGSVRLPTTLHVEEGSAEMETLAAAGFASDAVLAIAAQRLKLPTEE
jgi:hypothetical protein